MTSNADEYAAAMRLEDERVLERCRLALYEEGVDCQAMPVSKVPRHQLPEWVQPGDGGWLLLIEKEQFHKGMRRLARVMGYEEDEELA